MNDVGSPINGASTGDVNGDGVVDAVFHVGQVAQELVVLFGQSGLTRRLMSEGLRFRVPTFPSWFGLGPGLLTLGDLNGDGRDDIVLADNTYGRLFVYFGRGPTGGVVDGTTPDALLTGSVNGGFGTSVSVADMNGDGVVDLIAGAPVDDPMGRLDAGAVYVFFGGAGFASRTTAEADLVVLGAAGAQRGYLKTADVNGDGRMDLILGAPAARPAGRVNAGEVDVLSGVSLGTGTWDLSTRPPSLAVWGRAGDQLTVDGASDQTGDGRAEILVRPQTSFVDLTVVGAPWVAVPPWIIDLDPASSDYLALSTAAVLAILFKEIDFDGDGRRDLAFQTGTFPIEQVGVFPAAARAPGTFLSSSDAPSITITGHWFHLAAGDVNGDGADDLLLTPGPGWGISGDPDRVRLLPGHRPLTHPRLTARRTSPGAARARLELAVDGDPTEMRLTGDVDDPLASGWTPFAAEAAVTLTSGAGAKTVSATFRNAFGLISDAVSAALPPSENIGAGLTPITTRVRRRGRARWGLALTTGGTVTARIFAKDGRRLATLCDGDRGAGDWVLEWDGNDESGRRAAAGIYALTVECPDGRWRTNVAVE